MISVIIPTRSRMTNLRNTVSALFNQSLDKSEYEVIISDDNSQDYTFGILEENKSKGKIKYVFNNFKPHSWNASVPRNLGALVSDPGTKAYIFIDSDVIVQHNTLELYRNHMEKNSNRVMIGPYHWTNKMGGVSQEDVRWPKFMRVKPDEEFDRVHDGLACFGGNLCIPRDIFWSVSGFSVDTHIGLEDGDMGLKLWKKGVKFSYDRNLLGMHQWHETPSDRFPPNMKDHIDNLNLKHFKTKDPDYGIIEASRDAYEEWGITGWKPPESWMRMGLGMEVKIV